MISAFDTHMLETHLYSVARLKGTPHEDRGETYRVTVQEYRNQRMSLEKLCKADKWAHMKPVMKQYAARGKVDRSGSTSLMI